jgi:7,8-dihydroneopterin aldolase/epimerase/oxygenase
MSNFGVINALITMGKIQLEGMEFFAYHGCFAEEQIIGTQFTVDLEFDYDTSKAEQSDHLVNAVNYQEVYRVIKEEMDKKSYLLEHVGRRIMEAVKSAFPDIGNAKVRICKVNPPVGGKMRQVCCILGD